MAMFDNDFAEQRRQAILAQLRPVQGPDPMYPGGSPTFNPGAQVPGGPPATVGNTTAVPGSGYRGERPGGLPFGGIPPGQDSLPAWDPTPPTPGGRTGMLPGGGGGMLPGSGGGMLTALPGSGGGVKAPGTPKYTGPNVQSQAGRTTGPAGPPPSNVGPRIDGPTITGFDPSHPGMMVGTTGPSLPPGSIPFVPTSGPGALPGADPAASAPGPTGGRGPFADRLEGFDHAKLNSSHDSPKYQFARVFEHHDPKAGVTQALLDQLNALGLGQVSGEIGSDVITIANADPRFNGITAFDIVRDLGNGGWQWAPVEGAGGGGGGPEGGAGPGASGMGPLPTSASPLFGMGDPIAAIQGFIQGDYRSELLKLLQQVGGGAHGRPSA